MFLQYGPMYVHIKPFLWLVSTAPSQLAFALVPRQIARSPTLEPLMALCPSQKAAVQGDQIVCMYMHLFAYHDYSVWFVH